MREGISAVAGDLASALLQIIQRTGDLPCASLRPDRHRGGTIRAFQFPQVLHTRRAVIVLAADTVAAYTRRFDRRAVPEAERPAYLRWVRFYLDFCQKYGHPPRDQGSLPLFIAKLTAKNQPVSARQQAAQAVHLLLQRGYSMPNAEAQPVREVRPPLPEAPGHSVSSPPNAPRPEPKTPSDSAASVEISAPPLRESACSAESRPLLVKRPQTKASPHAPGSWEHEYRALEAAIKLRHYSAKTFAAYRMWVQKFQAFTHSKPPANLTSDDVKAFLSDLAVRLEVAASTQNQAFNALLFFYRHVLGREFEQLEGVVRAKRRPYIPTVLSREEVTAVLDAIEPPYRLVALLLYGCGLRLTECLELRVHCFDLQSRLLTIHDGKGQKDRSVPLPERLLPDIRTQLDHVRATLQADLTTGSAGTFLPRQLGRKYRNAARELSWQWFFPANTLTRIPSTEPTEARRYHLHDRHVQDAIKRAADKAGLTKRVSPHTFRHTFASHLLLAGYDLPTIQRLLGHGDVKTTMIYVQTVPSRTMHEVRSPLDLPE